jgi:outer membrane protein assembly factor BamB
MQMQMLLGQRDQAVSTARRNWLAAYELRSGKLRWHRGSSEAAEAVQGSFLSAPLPVGEALIVAVFDEGRIGLAALERSTGRTLWKTPLCDTPAGGMAPWAPVGLAADDGNVYVATGAGAIFALDALSGGVQWAVSYPRRLPADLAQQQQLQAAMMGGGGDTRAMAPSRAEFLENIAVRHDDAVVILAADTDFLFALDCRSGALRWEAPLAPPTGNGPVQDYLGVRNGKLFLAGPSAVRRYDLSGGRLEWERRVDGSCGRGLLTEKSLYLPQNNRIVQFDPDDGHELAVVDVMTPDGEPVGNLYGDGSRLYAVGAARVSALGPAQESK